MSAAATDYFYKAREFCIDRGFANEIALVNKRRFEDVTEADFFSQYAYVVLNAGMKNQVAEKMHARFMQSLDPMTIGHKGKRKAITLILRHCGLQFLFLKEAQDKIEFLSSLPWIGPITKHHLARNLGIDTAKPDRHLVRLANRLGFEDVHKMCGTISEKTGERVGVVDVILWRASNLGMS